MPEKDETTELLPGKNEQAVKFSTQFAERPKKIAGMDEQDKKEKLDSRRNKAGRDARKLYEVMLMKEIPEDKRPNAPTYAVLDSQVGNWKDVAEDRNRSVRNQALMHYIANLANSNSGDDAFNFDFVGSLVRNGADINCMDTNGQTIFHEVARSWHVDVALFLVENGANVNHQDQFGRSPLHVAAAVDYANMVEFIIQQGGDINIKTIGDEQTAMHYAAKNDAINSLQMLLGHGADIDARDSRNRTPLQVAAEMNSFKAAKLLVTEGAPAGVYDNLGNSALSLLIEKIPEVALIALDQFHTIDVINRREFFFLNYLEDAKLKDELHETPARSPLEIAVQNEQFDIIMHPVMRKLIALKWKIYGKRGAIMDMAFNLFHTIIWTIEGVTTPKRGVNLYHPVHENIWRLTMHVFIVIFTVMEIKKQVSSKQMSVIKDFETIIARRELVKWRESRAEQLQQDKQYCHPRWRQEEKYLNSEIEALENLSIVSISDRWLYFDWICLFLILAAILTNILFFRFDSEEELFWKVINNYTTIAMLVILWFRMFKYARPFENAGPYVVIFSNVVDDIAKWVVLNTAIFIPFTCAFWIGFGANSDHPATGYNTVSPLLYNMFQMMIIGDYKFEKLEEANPIMARILSGIFLLIAAIITLNLLIALVTNTFERLYENAVANAVMQRARTILLLQARMGKKKLKRYYDHIKTNASPQIIQNKYGRVMTKPYEDRATIDRVYDDVRQIKIVLAERFGKRYGKGNKSDLEIFREDLGKVKRSGKELARDIKNVKLILYGMGGQPVTPVRRSEGSRKDSREDEDDNVDGYEENNNNKNNKNNNNGDSTNKNHKNTNNKNSNNNNSDKTNSKNDNKNENNSRNNETTPTNKKSNEVNDTTTSKAFQPFHGDIQNQQNEIHDNPFPLAPILQSYLENLTHPKSGKKRNSGRRSSKKPEPSSSESSDSDEVFLPRTPPTFKKPKSHRWKGSNEREKKQGPLSKRSTPQREKDERWWQDYDQQSTTGSRKSMPLRYLQPEPIYTDLRPHAPVYASGSNVLPTNYSSIPRMTPHHPSLSQVHHPRSHLPTALQYFPRAYAIQSEGLDLAQQYRGISIAPGGPRVSPSVAMTYFPHEMQPAGQGFHHLDPGPRRRQPDHRRQSALIHSGAMQFEPLPNDELLYEDERTSSTRQEPNQEQPVSIEVPTTIQVPGNTDEGALGPTPGERTIWTKPDTMS